MFPPREIITDVNSLVFFSFYNFKCVAMKVVFGVKWPLLARNMNGGTLLLLEEYLPVRLPFCKCREILLQFVRVVLAVSTRKSCCLLWRKLSIKKRYVHGLRSNSICKGDVDGGTFRKLWRSKMTSICLPSDSPLANSWIVAIRCVAYDFLHRNPCWASVRMLCSSRWSMVVVAAWFNSLETWFSPG